MLTLQINNSEVESIFQDGFNGNKEKFLEFIQNSYRKVETIKAFEEDRRRFLETYKSMKNGSMKMLSEEEADQEINAFLKTL